MNAEQIVKKYLGTPYKHRGRDMTGLDCWGLIKLIFQDIGIRLWDIDEDYTPDWSWTGKDHFIENYWREWTPVQKPVIFDGLLFKIGSEHANHAGVSLGENNFIHATKLGVIVSKLGDRKFQGSLIGAYRMKSLIAACALFFLCIAQAFAAEVWKIEGNKITIEGDGHFDRPAFEARQDRQRAIVDAELAAIRADRQEVLKFKNALMLERAGAPQVNVQATAVNSNTQVNRQKAFNEN